MFTVAKSPKLTHISTSRIVPSEVEALKGRDQQGVEEPLVVVIVSTEKSGNGIEISLMPKDFEELTSDFDAALSESSQEEATCRTTTPRRGWAKN